MSPVLASILPFHEELFKKRIPACTHCGHSDGCSKWCGYRRYDPHTDGFIRIQRYLCPNRGCPAVTFSLVPFGFLPLLRISVGALCGLLVVAQFLSVNALAKALDCSRSTIRRRVCWGHRFCDWLTENLASIPSISWNSFYGLVFARFFPGRC